MTVPWLTQDQIQNYGLWLQSGAIVFSFVGVIIAATVSRRIARRRATLDMIMAEQSNDFLITSRRKFIELRQCGHLVKWADPSSVASEETNLLRTILNRYELIAIGIEESTLDPRVYKSYSRTTLVMDWMACKPFVVQHRQNTKTPTFYCKFESLAKKWANNSEVDHC